MYDAKTKPTIENTEAFINSIEDEQKRKDCQALVKLMNNVTGQKPKMWGPSIIGFGHYHYKYESGHEGDSFIVGFSPRKQNIALYITIGFDQCQDLLVKLGKFKTAKSCLYIKKMEDVDVKILQDLVTRAVKMMADRIP